VAGVDCLLSVRSRLEHREIDRCRNSNERDGQVMLDTHGERPLETRRTGRSRKQRQRWRAVPCQPDPQPSSGRRALSGRRHRSGGLRSSGRDAAGLEPRNSSSVRGTSGRSIETGESRVTGASRVARTYTDVRSYGLGVSCGERLAAGFSLGETEICTGDPRGSLVNPRSLGLRRQLPGSRRALQDETVAESI